MTNNYMGFDKFVWFQGVVEDRGDPLMLGRCKVRCLGFHDENKQKSPTENLPWAHPIQPLTSTAMSGMGETPLGPVEGTWVVGFFRDGNTAQEPIIFGVISFFKYSLSRHFSCNSVCKTTFARNNDLKQTVFL